MDLQRLLVTDVGLQMKINGFARNKWKDGFLDGSQTLLAPPVTVWWGLCKKSKFKWRNLLKADIEDEPITAGDFFLIQFSMAGVSSQARMRDKCLLEVPTPQALAMQAQYPHSIYRWADLLFYIWAIASFEWFMSNPDSISLKMSDGVPINSQLRWTEMTC